MQNNLPATFSSILCVFSKTLKTKFLPTYLLPNQNVQFQFKTISSTTNFQIPITTSKCYINNVNLLTNQTTPKPNLPHHHLPCQLSIHDTNLHQPNSTPPFFHMPNAKQLILNRCFETNFNKLLFNLIKIWLINLIMQ